jgi:ubiquinone/menaquinone biosynthesis C-methylase UbiE
VPFTIDLFNWHAAPMDSEPAGIIGVFDRAADTYDSVGVEWFGPIAGGLVDELAPIAGERALDIGCGRGAALFPLAEAVGLTGHVLGIDLSPRMVAATASVAAALPQVEVRVADASNPGLPAASFDVIASSLVLFFLTDPGAAVAGWHDLLVAGGRLGVATFGEQDPSWKAIDALFMPYLPPGMKDARTSGRQGPFASDEGVENLLSDAGLVDVRTVRSVVSPAFKNPEHWLDFSWSHGQRAMWEAVPAEQHEALQDAAFSLLEESASKTGTITFTQEVRYTLGRRS